MHPDAQRTKAAWRRYVETGELARTELRHHIYEAWRRCAELGVDPRAMAARSLSASETAGLLERKNDFIQAARPYLRALSMAAGSDRHAAMLGDENGIILDVVGDEETVHRTPGFPSPGSILSEDTAGANGIGTPLATGGYVDLEGPEHFIEGFHVYTCQGLPVRGPSGEVAGVLSTSVRRVGAAERVHEILICAAHAIEAELTRQRLEHEVEEVLRRDAQEGAALEALRQDVTQLQAAARLRLEKAARATSARPEGALELVLAAELLVQRFRRQSELWRDIAFGEVGVPQPVELCGRVVEIADLLSTEAAMRHLLVSVHATSPVQVWTDSRELSRILFRSLLQAFELASPRSEIGVAVLVDRYERTAMVCCSSSKNVQSPPLPLVEEGRAP